MIDSECICKDHKGGGSMTLNNEEKKIIADISINPFKFIKLDKFEIKKSIYNHSSVYIKGLIQEEKVKGYLDFLDEKEPEVIISYKLPEPVVLFRGFVTDYNYYFDEEINSLSIKAVSYSKILSYKEKNRIYQNQGTSYNDIFNKLCNDNNDLNISLADSFFGKELFVSKENPVRLQYKESDWCFLKRICSYNNEVLIVDDMVEGEKKINLQIGTHNLPVKEINIMNWSFAQTESIKNNYYRYYTIERYKKFYKDEIFVPGMKISFNCFSEKDEAIIFILVKTRIYIDNNILYQDFAFIKEEDFYIENISRKHSIEGKVFKGEIMQISADKKLKIYFLEIDDDFNEYRSFWFPINCVYWSFSNVLKVGDIVDVCLLNNCEQDTEESDLFSNTKEVQLVSADELINDKMYRLLDNLIVDLYTKKNSNLINSEKGDLYFDFMEVFWIRYKKKRGF